MQWVVIGGSYPGALAAWFKSLYSDLAVAAWASSAVINSFEDYRKFDEVILNRTLASKDGCAEVINNITN